MYTNQRGYKVSPHARRIKLAYDILSVLYNKEDNKWSDEYPLEQEYQMLSKCNTLMHHYSTDLLNAMFADHIVNRDLVAAISSELDAVVSCRDFTKDRMYTLFNKFSLLTKLRLKLPLLNPLFNLVRRF